MDVGMNTMARISKKEFLEAFNKQFKDYNDKDTVAIMTTISGHDYEHSRQSILFAEDIDF